MFGHVVGAGKLRGLPVLLLYIYIYMYIVDPNYYYTSGSQYNASHPTFVQVINFQLSANVIALFLWVEFLGVESTDSYWLNPKYAGRVPCLVGEFPILVGRMHFLWANNVEVAFSNSHVLGSSSKAALYCLCRRKSLRMPSSDICERRRRNWDPEVFQYPKVFYNDL